VAYLRYAEGFESGFSARLGLKQSFSHFIDYLKLLHRQLFVALGLVADMYTWVKLAYADTNPSVNECPSRNRWMVSGLEWLRGIQVRTGGTAVILFALWLLMSGVYEPIVIGFGAASVLLVIVITKRMDAVDGDQVDIRLKPFAFARYILWLLVEIAKANWVVTKIILSPSMPLRQHLFTIRYTQKTDLGQVIFANSITLTPGTISVETEPGHFLVHAVAYSSEDNLALADMDHRVSATEWVGEA